MYAEALKAKTLELRKARDPMASFLVSVSSRAADLAKSENPADPKVTDDHALRAINSFIKGADDNIALLAEQPEAELYVRATAERNLLKTFLPVEASEAEVRAEVEKFVAADAGATDRKKLMGPIMAHINSTFGASLNKKAASGIVQSVLNS